MECCSVYRKQQNSKQTEDSKRPWSGFKMGKEENKNKQKNPAHGVLAAKQFKLPEVSIKAYAPIGRCTATLHTY